MNFEMAKGNSTEDIVRATQKALIISMKQFVKELQEEVYKRLEDVPKESGSVAFAYHNAGEKLESYKAFKRENNL